MQVEGRGQGDLRAAAELAGWLARTVAVTLLLGAGVIWLRLLGGALRQPLSWSGLVLATVAAVAAAALVHLAWRLEAAWKRGQNGFLPSAIKSVSENSADVRSLQDFGSPGPPFPMPAGEVVQQLVRTRLADGSERLAGWLRPVLAPGQRSASVHLAFCPPFARSPRISIQQRDGPAVRVKEGQLLPYGARLDLKLAEAAQTATAIVLEILVQADSSPPVEIALAVVRRAEQVLIGPRPEGVPLAGLWEFPGGKVLAGESPEEAAIRECREETGLPICLATRLATVDHEYEHGRVRLYFFAAEPAKPAQAPRAPFRWVAIADLGNYAFPPANTTVLQSLGREGSSSP